MGTMDCPRRLTDVEIDELECDRKGEGHRWSDVVPRLIAEVRRLRKREEELYGEDFDKLHAAVRLAEVVDDAFTRMEDQGLTIESLPPFDHALAAYRKAKDRP